MWGHLRGLLLSKSRYYFLHQVSTTLNKFNRIPSFLCIQKGVCHAPSSVSRINIYLAPSRCPSTSGKHCWLKHHSSCELLAGVPATQAFGIYWESPAETLQGCKDAQKEAGTTLWSFTAGFPAARLASYLGSWP